MSHKFPLALREGNYPHLLYRQNYARWDIFSVELQNFGNKT